VLLLGPLMVAVMAIWERLVRTLPGDDLGILLIGALGWWGRALLAALVMMLLAYFGTISALFGDLGREILAPRTSPLVFVGAALTVAAWLGSRPLRTVGRLAQFWATFTVVLTVAVGLLGLRHLDWPRALLPPAAVGVNPVWQGLVQSLYLLAPYPLWMTVQRRIQAGRGPRTDAGGPYGHRARCYLYGALIGQWVLLGQLYELAVGTLGTWPVALLAWPAVFTYELIELSSFFITEVGVLVVILWTVVFVVFLAVNIWHLALLATRVLPSLTRFWGDILVVMTVLGLGLSLVAVPYNLTVILTENVSRGVLVWTTLVLLSLLVRALLARFTRRRLAVTKP
jgi:hypothetical protein